ncbi:hypothetical protein V490_03642 [Pseudogymnoascus sp. VKM F-3557]|nr:hypothetical protein V490_03642 [Pseudogymnoascus sp. VKM F-3557]
MSTLDQQPNIAVDESTQTETPLLNTDDVTELIENIKSASNSEFLPYGSSVFDHSAMAPASPAAAAALARLRAYVPPPFPIWNNLPVSRRAAVLLLLFADRRGDLRVVVTMRAASLRNYSGHAALPGGKADTLEETPFQIARREAFEEIGLPMDDSKLPKSIRIEHLCQLPFNLAKTELAVSPCVAYLHSDGANGETAEEAMIPTLDAKEVAAVFSAPFHNFLKLQDEVPEGETVPGSKSDWYEGSWVDWHDGYRWRVHNFYVPVNNQKVTKPKVREGGLKAIAEQLEEEEEAGMERYKHNEHYGDEKLMETLFKIGRMGEKKAGTQSLTREEIAKEAAKIDPLLPPF